MNNRGYEKLISCIQMLNGEKQVIYITQMDTSSSLHINDLPLEREDLWISDNITDLKAGDTVLVVKINEEQYAIVERMMRL